MFTVKACLQRACLPLSSRLLTQTARAPGPLLRNEVAARTWDAILRSAYGWTAPASLQNMARPNLMQEWRCSTTRWLGTAASRAGMPLLYDRLVCYNHIQSRGYPCSATGWHSTATSHEGVPRSVTGWHDTDTSHAGVPAHFKAGMAQPHPMHCSGMACQRLMQGWPCNGA